MGEPTATEQGATTGLVAPAGQLRITSHQGKLQRLGQAAFEIADVVATQVTAPRPQAGADAAQQPWSLQQLGGQGAGTGVVGVEQLQALTGMGDRHPLQQLQNGIHHQIRQQLAGDKHHARPRLPQPDQLEQLTFLVVMRPLHQRHLLGAHIQGRHHQHIPGVAPWSHLSDIGLQLALQILKGQHHNTMREFSNIRLIATSDNHSAQGRDA